MNISEGFIRRPIATSLLMAAIVLFGVVAYRSLPVSDLPNVDFPTLLVTAQLPGASPDTMASSVATPLENQFSMIAGLESMTSVNSLGSTQVTLEFNLDRNLDGAAVDVQAAITQAARLLPQGMPTPPTFTKVNPADQPILYLVITSTTMTPWALDEYAETRIAQRISMVSGVAQVQVLGSQKYAVHVQLDPRQLASRQIGINEVEASIRNWNVNSPTGTIVGPHKAFTLQASGQLMDASQFKAMVVSYRNGSPVRLEELGTILDGVEDPTNGLVVLHARHKAAGDHARHSAAAGHEHDRRRRCGEEPAAGVPRAAAGQRAHGRPLRSLRHDPRIVPRRADDDGADAGARHFRHLHLPEERPRDRDPEPGAAVLDHRHVRGDVSPQLQPRQPVDDGVDPVGRLRRRRRDRHAGERVPPRRGRR